MSVVLPEIVIVQYVTYVYYNPQKPTSTFSMMSSSPLSSSAMVCGSQLLLQYRLLLGVRLSKACLNLQPGLEQLSP